MTEKSWRNVVIFLRALGTGFAIGAAVVVVGALLWFIYTLLAAALPNYVMIGLVVLFLIGSTFTLIIYTITAE